MGLDLNLGIVELGKYCTDYCMHAQYISQKKKIVTLASIRLLYVALLSLLEKFYERNA